MSRSWPPVCGISVDAVHNKGKWDHPECRRSGLRELHRLHRYGFQIRAPRVRPLSAQPISAIAELQSVQRCVQSSIFNGLIVLQEDVVLYEQYASDFSSDCIHSIQSISKTMVHLLIGSLIASGKVDPSLPVRAYLPEVGSGYADATVQQVLDMSVINYFSEDYSDPQASIGRLEEAHGWRVAEEAVQQSLRAYLSTIEGESTPNTLGEIQYKTANTDIAAWIYDVVDNQGLREAITLLIEEAGISDSAFISSDREGVAFLGGGLHMTLRDLARYGRLFCHDSNNEQRRLFLNQTRNTASSGTRYDSGTYYHNFLETNGDWVGHLGYGGQYLYVQPERNLVIACLNSHEGELGLDLEQISDLISMCHCIDKEIDKHTHASE